VWEGKTNGVRENKGKKKRWKKYKTVRKLKANGKVSVVHESYFKVKVRVKKNKGIGQINKLRKKIVTLKKVSVVFKWCC